MLVTLYDPPRPNAKQLITALQDLGVSVKMLTIGALAFLAIAFAVTGKFVVSAFAMLLVFMMDFAKIVLASDYVRPSKRPETWTIGGFVTVSVVLGVAMVAEAHLLLSMEMSTGVSDDSAGREDRG